jgi:hypothetical protein
VAFPIEEGFELGRRWIAHKWESNPPDEHGIAHAKLSA